jgi:hypothetical protein
VKHVAGWWLVERPKGEGPITLWDDIDDTGAVQDEAHGQQSDPPAV